MLKINDDKKLVRTLWVLVGLSAAFGLIALFIHFTENGGI